MAKPDEKKNHKTTFQRIKNIIYSKKSIIFYAKYLYTKKPNISHQNHKEKKKVWGKKIPLSKKHRTSNKRHFRAFRIGFFFSKKIQGGFATEKKFCHS